MVISGKPVKAGFFETTPKKGEFNTAPSQTGAALSQDESNQATGET